MKLQYLIIVLLRLMALNCLFEVVVHAAGPLLSYLSVYDSRVYDEAPVLAAMPWLMLIGLVGSAILLWVLAFPIAQIVTYKLPQDISFGTMSLADGYSIAFIGVALFYFTGYLPQVLNWTHFIFKIPWVGARDQVKEEVDWYQVSQAFFPFVFAVLLFLKSRSWAMALASRQQQSENPNKPLEPPGASL